MEEFTRIWKVYGRRGHRQQASFGKSFGFSDYKNEPVRKVALLNSDVTGTNEYSVIVITREDLAACESEFEGQLTDGAFEDSSTGKIEEIALADAPADWMAAAERLCKE